jgi:hypothetical protein
MTKLNYFMKTNLTYFVIFSLLTIGCSPIVQIENGHASPKTPDVKNSPKETSSADTSVMHTKGIYFPRKINVPSTKTYPNVYTDPNIDGVALGLSWKSMEPSPGKYDFDDLDKELMGAFNHGKKITLGVIAGTLSPDWFFDKYPKSKLDFDLEVMSSHRCRQVQIPIPWDPEFLGHWNSFLKAFAAHVRASPAYPNVELVFMSGITRITRELRLPYQTSAKMKKSQCSISNAVEIWKGAGYMPQKVLSAFNDIETTLASEFPNRSIGLMIVRWKTAFPDIDMSGQPYNHFDMNTPLIESSKKLLGNRLELFYASLSEDNEIPSEMLSVVKTSNVNASYQLEAMQFGTPDVAVNCADLKKAFAMGNNNSMHSIEIFGESLRTCPSEVAALHSFLAK